jgi:hypothetical protein
MLDAGGQSRLTLMDPAAWEQRVLIFSIGCHGVLLWRLWSQKLARTYLFLTIFLLAELLQNAAFLPIQPRSTLYGWVFLLSTPVLWILAYFVVLELYRLILEDYPGISSAGRRGVTWSMGAALLISLIYAVPAFRAAGGKFPALSIYWIAERSTVLGLLLFIVLIQLFLYRYRLKLPRNRVVYATGYALYFGIGVAQDVVLTALGIRVVEVVTLWIVAASGVILVIGAVLLSHKYESRPGAGRGSGGADGSKLQEQLAEMNRLLTRAARGSG